MVSASVWRGDLLAKSDCLRTLYLDSVVEQEWTSSMNCPCLRYGRVRPSRQLRLQHNLTGASKKWKSGWLGVATLKVKCCSWLSYYTARHHHQHHSSRVDLVLVSDRE